MDDFIYYDSIDACFERDLFGDDTSDEEIDSEEEDQLEEEIETDNESDEDGSGEDNDVSNENSGNDDIHWSPEFIHFNRRVFNVGLAGENTGLHLGSTALQLFQLFFTSSLIQHIVASTNAYASHIINKYSPASAVRRHLEKTWYAVSELELLAFFGTLFLSGVVQVKSWTEYFSPDPLTHQTSFSKVFSLQWWFQIKRFLYFEDPDPLTHQTSFSKVFSLQWWFQIKRFLYFEDPDRIISHKLGKIWTVYTTLQVSLQSTITDY
jgi:hypothetical protein